MTDPNVTNDSKRPDLREAGIGAPSLTNARADRAIYLAALALITYVPAITLIPLALLR
jgi:hypothetical protein